MNVLYISLLGPFGAGGKTARPIWDRYMLKVCESPAVGYGKGLFKRPAEDLDITLNCSQYSAANEDDVELEEITIYDLN